MLREEMRLSRAQVGESMSIGYRTPRTSSRSTWRHGAHHGTSLTDLGSSGSRHTGVYLLDHSSAGVHSTWMLSVGHRMTRRQTRMLLHALMGSERLRHHHCWVTKSPSTRTRARGINETREGKSNKER